MLPLTAYTDNDLMQLTAQGDEKAFTELFHRYKNKLFGFVLKLTGSTEQAQDVTQEVFTKIWEQRSQLSQVKNFNAYIATTARNDTINSFRRMARYTLIVHELAKMQQPGNEADASINIKEGEATIAKAIEQLSPQQKLIYKMSREQGLKHDEIAKILQLSPGTVNNHMIRALRTLRDYLQNQRDNAAVIILFISIVDAFEK